MENSNIVYAVPQNSSKISYLVHKPKSSNRRAGYFSELPQNYLGNPANVIGHAGTGGSEPEHEYANPYTLPVLGSSVNKTASAGEYAIPSFINTRNLTKKNGRPLGPFTLNKSSGRIAVSPEKYNTNICNGIYSKDDLDKTLQIYTSKIEIGKPDENQNDTTKGLYFNLIPYCGEFVQISKHINKVNASVIETDVLDKLSKKFFNVQESSMFRTQFNGAGIKATTTQYVSEFNPEKFKTIIDNINLRDKLFSKVKSFSTLLGANNIVYKNHALIVVHSHFLRSLTSLYGNKVYFDNLDMLHIVIEIDSSKITKTHLFVRRFNENYKNPKKLLETGDEYSERLATESCKNIFLLRHCIACHNIIEKVMGSRPLAHLKQKIIGQLGYSLYSTCSEYTIKEINDKKESLLELFDKTCGGLDKIQFGSSCIFRAILTVILLYKILKYEQNQNGDRGLLDLAMEL